MFRIGEFSRIAHVSCRLLRYYDQIGLLRPAHTDEESGYRFYSALQLPRLNRILVLRDLGLSLEQIAELLEAQLPAAELRGMLLLRQREVERTIIEHTEQLRRIEGRLRQIEGEAEPDTDDIVVRPEPARLLLSFRRTLGSLKEGLRSVGEVVRVVPQRVPEHKLDQFVVIVHAPEYEPEELDVEIGFFLKGPLNGPVEVAEGHTLVTREVPALERVAACVRHGAPDQAHTATANIGHFLEQNGYRVAGPNREVFLKRPTPGRPEDNLVEMQFPIEPVVEAAQRVRR